MVNTHGDVKKENKNSFKLSPGKKGHGQKNSKKKNGTVQASAKETRKGIKRIT